MTPTENYLARFPFASLAIKLPAAQREAFARRAMRATQAITNFCEYDHTAIFLRLQHQRLQRMQFPYGLRR